MEVLGVGRAGADSAPRSQATARSGSLEVPALLSLEDGLGGGKEA